jgi:hypothetical protein
VPATQRPGPYFGRMKRAFFLLLCVPVALLTRPAHAQAPGPDSLGQVAHYEQVVPVLGASAEDLYARAREWVALTFEDAHQVVQLDDPQRHLLLGSGYTQLLTRRNNGTVKNVASLWFSFRVETRAGRYRVACTDFGIPHSLSSTATLADLTTWVTASQATRAASQRHSAPGATWNEVMWGEYPAEKLRAKKTLEEAVSKLFTTLQQVETAPAGTW